MPSIQPVSYQILVRVFERDGFRFARQSGDHLIYVKPGVKRPLVILPIVLFRYLLFATCLELPECHEIVTLNSWVIRGHVEPQKQTWTSAANLR